MTDKRKLEIVLWSFGGGFIGLLVVHHFLDYFRNPVFLSGLILIEIVMACLWHFRSAYFLLTIVFFTWAGMRVPLEGAAMTARWIVLGAGAMIGAVIWLREKRQRFNHLHLVAFLCVPVSAVTAIESTDPTSSLMKVASLFLLFLYCTTGARLAMVGRESQFVQSLLLGCEVIVYISAVSYMGGVALWGNPNSLGAVVGVVMAPFLLWGFLTADTQNRKYRMLCALVISAILLYVALSRASLFAAAVACVTLCVCLKRQRVLVEGAFAIVLFLAAAAVLNPSHFEQFSTNFTTEILYKGKTQQLDVFGSRRGPWDDTIASLKQHPWFGTGFGTSDLRTNTQVAQISAIEGIYTKEGTNREHGNSYLAIAEYVGILGILFFGFLLLLVLRMVLKVCWWMRRTQDAYHPAVPLAIICLAGLVHAFFEDWLIAVGYYLCFFFWVSVFLLNDLMPQQGNLEPRSASPAHPHAVVNAAPVLPAAR